MPTAVRVQHGEHRATGFTKGGESWAAAATRLGRGEVWPVDLSEPVKEFTRDEWPWVALRPLTNADHADLTAWLGEPHVARWFGEVMEPSWASDRDSVWVAECNGRSVGFAHDYPMTDLPHTVGIDYAVGDLAFVSRGVGTRLVWAILRGVRDRYPAAESVLATPDHRNVASLRVLEKCGFTSGEWLDRPETDGTVATVVSCTADIRTVLGY